MKWRKLLLWGIPALLLFIQLFRIDKKNPPVVQNEDFRTVMQPPAEVMRLIETSCYDCHSHETQYPWYADIAPSSWLLANHIEEGREHVNFSTFGRLNADDRAHALHECAETLEEGEMPVSNYLWLHSEARLSEEQRSRLAEWFENSNPSNIGAIGVEDDRMEEHE